MASVALCWDLQGRSLQAQTVELGAQSVRIEPGGLFICEPGRTHYLDLLKATFPKAEMIGGASAIEDFEIIRGAKNVALSISSFSWMATFLSSKSSKFTCRWPAISIPPMTSLRTFYR